MEHTIFFDISILLGLTVTVAFFLRLARLPLITAYIISGVLAGPLFLNTIQQTQEDLSSFARFGVVLLLFVVGMNLNLRHIKQIGKVATIVGLGQMLCIGSLGFLILQLMHLPLTSSLYLAIAITFSSTIIVVKLLSDKQDTESTYGRYVLGLMIFQDIIATLLLLFIGSYDGSQDLLPSLGLLAMKGVFAITIILFLAKYVLSKILDKIATSSEYLFIFTVAWCFGVSSLLYALGFSLELGAVIAGFSLGSSPYQAHIVSRIRPIRDFFIVLFFIILGSEIGSGDISLVLLPAIALSGLVLFGTSSVVYHLFRLEKFSRRNSFLAATTVSQVSEFGFIIIFTAQQLGHLQGFELSLFTMVTLITTIVSSYIITFNEQTYRLLLPIFNFFGPDKNIQKEISALKFDVLIFGYHRVGWKICEGLAQKKISFAVVDFNPEIIKSLKARGIPAFFGDAADVEFLSILPLSKIKMVISTLPAHDDQIVLFKYVRSVSPKAIIIGNLYYNTYLAEVYSAGANYVMLPHLLGGHFMSEVFSTKPWTTHTFNVLKKQQKQDMNLQADGHEE